MIAPRAAPASGSARSRVARRSTRREHVATIVEHAIFDLHDTLVDARRCQRRAWQWALRDVGCSVPQRRRLLKRVEAGLDAGLPTAAIAARLGLEPDLQRAVVLAKRNCFDAWIIEDAEPLPAARAILPRLAPRTPLSVVTLGDRTVALRVLSQCGFGGLVAPERVHGRSSVFDTIDKTALLQSATAACAAAAANTVYVGDGEADSAAAATLGLRFVSASRIAELLQPRTP